MNSSNNYYTSCEHDVMFTKIGANKTSLLYYTYYINRNIAQNHTLNENRINNYDEDSIANGTSDEYDLQSVYNGNGLIGTITELSQVYLATYDTSAQPFVYTGSENIDTTHNQISLNCPTKINNEIVLNPRACDNAVFEMTSGTGNFAFRQKRSPWRTDKSSRYSSTKACTFLGSCVIPNMYNKTSVYILKWYLF